MGYFIFKVEHGQSARGMAIGRTRGARFIRFNAYKSELLSQKAAFHATRTTDVYERAELSRVSPLPRMDRAAIHRENIVFR